MPFRFGAGIGGDDDGDEAPIRWQLCPLPLGDLAFIKGGGVAGDDCLHHRMLRLKGLQQTKALAPGATCTTGHLREQLKGSLRRARVAIRQPDIGIDDPDQGHQREVMPLGHELSSDDDVGLAIGDRLQFEP